ncbi:serine/threonine protein kinase [Luteimonas aestuarii]|uniref:mitogen-activated protein kinase kinase n=1 Tax=Luteimonas aestuarii TaxID=453837 RepID=A0A4R5TQT8_9GAMM|nr:protein kinase [Luteimonas aestuarii]TDK21063.1 serine/threonine protein kinase [Luteimonas aestuarii]
MISIEDVHKAFPELGSLALIASSGQKHVFRVTKNGGLVLKLIKSSDSSGARAAREAEAVARLRSRYVPEMLEVGEREVGGTLAIYFLERFISGKTYRDILSSGPQSLSSVIDLADALLTACCEFEAATLVHRDIKPENIIVDEAGSHWILDFGIVRLLDMDSVTKTSDRFGPFTPGYGAPEQIRNLKDSIDIRADIFSVGVVMYEALLGRNPYLHNKRDALAVIKHMLDLDLDRLDAQVAGSLPMADFISALTSRFPSRRPESAGAALQWFSDVRCAVIHS